MERSTFLFGKSDFFVNRAIFPSLNPFSSKRDKVPFHISDTNSSTERGHGIIGHFLFLPKVVISISRGLRLLIIKIIKICLNLEITFHVKPTYDTFLGHLKMTKMPNPIIS